MKVTLLAYTQNAQKIIASAAKLCYSSTNIDNITAGLTNEKTSAFVEMLSEIGHESPIEHANFTFGIEGVSRALLAQFTRHRIASYSVQSQRYVKENQFEYVVPPEIENNKQSKELFIKTMNDIQDSYDKLAEVLKNKHYKELLKTEPDEKKALKAAEKMAIEDARFVLPNACETKMIVTMNARSLNNFFAHRCCNRAQWEIREAAKQMLILVLKEAPDLFKNSGPPCVKGKCPEGKMSCGKMAEVKALYENLKGKK